MGLEHLPPMMGQIELGRDDDGRGVWGGGFGGDLDPNRAWNNVAGLGGGLGRVAQNALNGRAMMKWGPNGGQVNKFEYKSDPITDQLVAERQWRNNPFNPILPDWGSGGYWDQQNKMNAIRGLTSQQQAPERAKIAFMENLFGPNGAMGKFLGGLGGIGGAGGIGGIRGFQSVNSPQMVSLGPLLNQMTG